MTPKLRGPRAGHVESTPRAFAPTPDRGDDFAALRKLAEACGKRFAMGAVPFGQRMFAAPITTLWGAPNAK